MPRRPAERWTLLCSTIIGAQILLTVAGQFGCGGDNLEFLGNGNGDGGNADDNVEISGDLISIPSAQHLAVFVFINLGDPGSFTTFTDSKNDSISTTKMTFTLRNLRAGNASLYVVDDADQDGQVDAAEQFSLLEDEDNCLRGLQSAAKVVIADITVDFADGTAESTAITKNGIVCSGTPPPQDQVSTGGPE